MFISIGIVSVCRNNRRIFIKRIQSHTQARSQFPDNLNAIARAAHPPGETLVTAYILRCSNYQGIYGIFNPNC